MCYSYWPIGNRPSTPPKGTVELRLYQPPRPPMSRPPLPPFTRETAAQKARMAEDAWNSRDPERVAPAYTEDSLWPNPPEFFERRAAIVTFLPPTSATETDDRP